MPMKKTLRKQISKRLCVSRGSIDRLDKTALKAVLAITSMGDFEKFYITEAEDEIDCWVIVDDIDIMDDLMLTSKAMEISDTLKREIRCLSFEQGEIREAYLPPETIVFQRRKP